MTLLFLLVSYFQSVDKKLYKLKLEQEKCFIVSEELFVPCRMTGALYCTSPPNNQYMICCLDWKMAYGIYVLYSSMIISQEPLCQVILKP